jgi:hypothetical protein
MDRVALGYTLPSRRFVMTEMVAPLITERPRPPQDGIDPEWTLGAPTSDELECDCPNDCPVDHDWN